MDLLEKRLQNRDTNNLDFLRFFAASLVILGHCYPFVGINSEPLSELTGYEGFGRLGVNIFFFLSGLLITRSWQMSTSTFSFVQKRCLRIFPGLAAATIFCVLIVGPIGTILYPSQYFSDPITYRFLWNAVWPAHYYYLPGVFAFNPVQAVNGSLWTLPVELRCYALVFLAGVARLLKPKLFPVVVIAALTKIFWPYAVLGWHGTDLTKYVLNNWETCYVHFLLGSAAYIYRRHIPLNRWLAFAAAALFLGTLSTGWIGYAASFLSLPYLILYVSQVPLPGLSRWAKHGDLSYGLYIYAFPIQGLVVQTLGTKIGVGTLFFSTMGLTMMTAYLSWHWVERPALVLRWKWHGRNLAPRPLEPPSGMQAAA